MSVASRRPRGHGARALEEALGAVAAPTIRDEILGSALARAGLVAVPEAGEELDGFVRSDFRHAIADRLGEDVAEGVMTDLWPLLAMMVQRRPKPMSVRPRSATNTPRPVATVRPAATITARPPAIDDESDEASGVVVVGPSGKTIRAGDSLSVILAVTRDTTRTRTLALALAGKAVVRSVLDLIEMAEAIEDHRGELPVVLFDCANAPFHLESVATFASELPCGSWLALLDGTMEHERAARTFAGSTLTVARLSSSLGMDDVAHRCLALFD